MSKRTVGLWRPQRGRRVPWVTVVASRPGELGAQPSAAASRIAQGRMHGSNELGESAARPPGFCGLIRASASGPGAPRRQALYGPTGSRLPSRGRPRAAGRRNAAVGAVPIDVREITTGGITALQVPSQQPGPAAEANLEQTEHTHRCRGGGSAVAVKRRKPFGHATGRCTLCASSCASEINSRDSETPTQGGVLQQAGQCGCEAGAAALQLRDDGGVGRRGPGPGHPPQRLAAREQEPSGFRF